jgi:hypothetical protein
MTTRHRVFVSYHHANDESRKKIFILRFGNRFGSIIPGAVELGDIDPNLQTETIRTKIRDNYLSNTSVTVVLVGTDTWRRKHVDWEISSSIRATKNNPRSGLLGILLPSYMEQYGIDRYNPRTIPARLHLNAECGYARIHPWSEDPDEVAAWIHAAYNRKYRYEPDNSYPLYRINKQGSGWG